MKLAVIPARGGSKRIPRKNIRQFHGKPMLAWSIELARACGVFDQIVVSTDDPDIAAIARQWGAAVPFVRPAVLSDDHAGTTAVIGHASQWARDAGLQPEAVCCIYATAPFLQAADVLRGLALLESGSWAYAFSVTDFAAPIFRAFAAQPDGGIAMFFPEHFATRSQDLPVALHDAGQFYWGRPQAWIDGLRIFDHHSAPVPIPRWRVQDIDTPDDWVRAELLAPAILGSRE